MDPLTALAAIKTGVAAGKQLHNLSKEIAGFFDATDGAKKAHAKKKNGIFATANEEAMATWTQAQNAKTAEAELREFIVNTKGFSAYQELLKIRREVIAQRKEADRQAQKEAEERAEMIMTVFAVLLLIVAAVSGAGAWLYYKGSGPTVPELTGAYFFRPGRDLFGRVTAGYLEPMFAGVSTELLWAPEHSRLALGAELNRVRQRGYDQRFDLRDYEVTTGHLSAYYQFTDQFFTQLDVGRYLAGDWGATLSFSRVFDNGWKVGVYATKTDVSSADFGEGSFDKGLFFQVPLDGLFGGETRGTFATRMRPIQRDGGQRLDGFSGDIFWDLRAARFDAFTPDKRLLP